MTDHLEVCEECGKTSNKEGFVKETDYGACLCEDCFSNDEFYDDEEV